jgi:hypothetical protein
VSGLIFTSPIDSLDILKTNDKIKIGYVYNPFAGIYVHISNNETIVQFIIEYNSYRIYFRTYHITWSNWKTLFQG